MSGVHCLQHVETFFTANFAEHDAVGTHAKRVDDELALTHGTIAFHVGRPRFKANDMLLLERELG